MSEIEKIVQFVREWFETRTILAQHNTPLAIIDSLAEEGHEFVHAIAESVHLHSPEVLEEIADLVLFAVQLLVQLGQNAHVFLHGIFAADTVSLAKEITDSDIHGTIVAMKNKKNQEEKYVPSENLSDDIALLLIQILSFCTNNGLPDPLLIANTKAAGLDPLYPSEYFATAQSFDVAYKACREIPERGDLKGKIYTNLAALTQART